MLVIMEEKVSEGNWQEVYSPFPTVLKGVDYCADMNEKVGQYRYRVCVITDPEKIKELEDGYEQFLEECQREEEEHIEFNRKTDEAFEAAMNENFPERWNR